MRPWKTVAGAAAGATAASVAAGVAAGVAAERYAVNRLRGRLDPKAIAGFDESHGRSLTVVADDGVPLHVEVDGTEGSGADNLTLVFCHGWTLELASWCYQRRELGDIGRMVFWDQRGHGRSGRGSRDGVTIDRLGEDLRAVLDAVAPAGRLLLAGHSMGGMTIMALAESYPVLFRDRVTGVALIGTAARGLGELVPGVYGAAMRRATPGVLHALGSARKPVERARAMGRLVSHVATHRFGFGDTRVSPEMVAFLDRMISSTSIDVIADFYPALLEHDKLAALRRLPGLPAVVVAGTRDLLIPADAARVIVDALPEAEYVEADGAGHLVMLERPGLVNGAIRSLARRVSPRVAATAGGEPWS